MERRFELIIYSSGRKIFFSVSGDESGLPVLFINGAGMDGTLSFCSDLLKKSGIKLISLDRPGFGQSDFDENKSFESITNDISELLKKLKISKIDAVAFSQGAPFLYALCKNELIAHAVVVSGQDDFQYVTTQKKISKDFLSFINSVCDEKNFIQNLEKFSAADFYNFVVSTSSEIDKKTYLHPVFSNKFLRCLENGIGKSFQAYCQDLKLCLSPWPFNIEEIKTQIVHVYGANDTSPFHSPDFGLTLRARNSCFNVDILNDGGGGLIWTHGDYILKIIKEKYA